MLPPSAALLRRRAEALVRQERYAEAADAYRQEAAAYRRLGDPNAAEVEETKADRWTGALRMFVPRSAFLASPVSPASPASIPSRALWEPSSGCYSGAFLDRDERLGPAFLDENDQPHRDPATFGRRTGKKPASVFCYLSYGRRFPARWVARLRAQNVAPHIAWEPNHGLDAVADDAYLRRFADDAARAECPIFLRFAGEMNGDWTRWGGDPLRYRTAWGIVKNVMARRAPNVALVWCVNAVPKPPIPRYYPGDEFVDWVGVNFYSVPFYDNNPARSGEHANPADALRFVYDRYAARKPLMICEWGASHRAALDGRDRSEWAALKIAQLYAALPRLYPRVKLIDIFDNDNIRHAQPARQLNNYSVTDSEIVRQAYAQAIADDWFLGDIVSNPEAAGAPDPLVPLNKRDRVRPGILRVSAWARCYVPRPVARYALDGREVFRSSVPGPYAASIALDKPGPHRLTATLPDDRGRVAVERNYEIEVR